MNSIIILFIFIQSCFSYLSRPQLQSICKILSYKIKKNDNYNITIAKRKTQKILFEHSKPFAYKKYDTFVNNSKVAKRFYYSKKNILLTYGYMGLWKAILNYSGYGNFYDYASIYIDGELKKGMTDIFSSSILPHRFRVNKKFMTNNTDIYRKSFVLPLSFSDTTQNKHKMQTKKYSFYEFYELYKLINNNLTPTEKLYFNYKYDIFSGRKIRSNKHVGELMCVSEEKARSELNEIRKKYKNLFRNITVQPR
tara:strand:- start:2840 stop:3595 length:756 start_codon:yes stop_codon:yes gene_type:complete